MDALFEAVLSLGPAAVLLALLLVVVALLVWRAARRPFLAQMALRYLARRRVRTALIAGGLMLATMFVTAGLAINDTILLAVKTVAVYNLGRTDEEVTGGSGPLGLFSTLEGYSIQQRLAGDARVSGVAPGLVVPDLLVTDQRSRQVRGGVLGVALQPTAAGPLADLRAADGAPAPIPALAPDEVYVNRSLATLLDVRAGDDLSLYSASWPGTRHAARVRAVVSGGVLGARPSLLLPLPRLQSYLGPNDVVNRVFIANAGDGISGVGFSAAVAAEVRPGLPQGMRITLVKQQGVEFALRAQDVFGRILTLFTLFAFAVSLLLIFLIFALLAAERRAELGMARAVGMRRSHIVTLLVLEGALYDAAAAVTGIVAGVVLGRVILAIVTPTVARLGFPLRPDLRPASVALALSLGFLFALATVALAAWVVSRATIAAALRDLPEPPAEHLALGAALRRALGPQSGTSPKPHARLAAWADVGAGLVVRGIVPLLLGLALLRWATSAASGLVYALAVTVAYVGLVLLLRWWGLLATQAIRRRRGLADTLRAREQTLHAANRLAALAIGVGLVLYWSLPFDALRGLGLPRFGAGIEVFFAAGMMMVFGATLAFSQNLEVLLAPARWLLARVGRARHVAYIAYVYPAQHRFRTAIGLALFSLICFTMVVMACIAASTTQGAALPTSTIGYDIIGQSLLGSTPSTSTIATTLDRTAPAQAANISAIGAARPLPLGIVQPGKLSTRWQVYPGAQVEGALLAGEGLPLVARAQGFASDADVWRAVREQPGAVVIDVGALSPRDAAALGIAAPPPVSAAQFLGPPLVAALPGVSSVAMERAQTALAGTNNGIQPYLGYLIRDPEQLSQYTLQMENVVTGPGTIAPIALWIADLRGGGVTKVNVVGLVANPRGLRSALYGSAETFAPVERGLPPYGSTYYYFKLRAGSDGHAAAYSIGSALLDRGFETTVLSDILQDINGPRLVLSRLLIGLVGMTLLIGMAALGVSSSRAVVERRQQIGMLRALGFRQAHISLLFLSEGLLVSTLGIVIGLVLGLVLARNVFAVDFFAQVQSGLTLVIPWREVALICVAALAASFVAVVLPAWQAARVAPADALRYE